MLVQITGVAMLANRARACTSNLSTSTRHFAHFAQFACHRRIPPLYMYAHYRQYLSSRKWNFMPYNVHVALIRRVFAILSILRANANQKNRRGGPQSNGNILLRFFLRFLCYWFGESIASGTLKCFFLFVFRVCARARSTMMLMSIAQAS